VIPIKEIGEYWEVNSNNCIVNNYKNLELLPITKKIVELLLRDVFVYIPYVHSIYLSGAYLNRNITESSDIDFAIVLDNSGTSSEYIPEDDERLGKSLYEFKNNFQKILKHSLDINSKLDLTIESYDFFKFDLLNSRFISKCIWGSEDLSLNELNFDSISPKILDGLETEDHIFLKEEYDKILNIIEYFTKDQIIILEEKLKSYVKIILRCCFSTVCKKTKIWTRDLYYCSYFFLKENPDFKNDVEQLLNLYLNPQKEVSEVKKIILRSKNLIDHIIRQSSSY